MIICMPLIARWLVALVVLDGALVSSTLADEPSKPTPAFHVYLLIGQSNMAGRGLIEEVDKVPHPRVLMLNKQNAWVPAVDPLHFDKSVAGVGLGSTFGRVMAEAEPEVTIG